MACKDSGTPLNGSRFSAANASPQVLQFTWKNGGDDLSNAAASVTLTAGAISIVLTSGAELTNTINTASKQEFKYLITQDHKIQLLNGADSATVTYSLSVTPAAGTALAGDYDSDYTGTFEIIGPAPNNSLSKVYVDSADGSDTTGGGTESNPVASIGRAIELAASTATIYLRPGRTWSELVILPSAMTLTAWAYVRGSNVMPKITTLKTITNTSFVAEGTTNVYKVTVPSLENMASVPSALSAEPTPFIYEDGEPLQYVASIATCGTTPGSFTYTATNQSFKTQSNTLYVHPRSSTNPTNDDKAYQWTGRLFCVGTESSAHIENLWLEGSGCSAGVLFTGQSATIRNCLLQWGTKHVAQAGANSAFDGCIFYNEVPEGDAWIGGRTHAVIFEHALSGTEAATYRNCVSRKAKNFGYFVHSSSGNFATATVADCYASNIGNRAYAFEDCNTVDMDNIYADDYLVALDPDTITTSIETLTALNHREDGGLIRGGLAGGGPITANNLAIAGTNNWGPAASSTRGAVLAGQNHSYSQVSYQVISNTTLGSNFAISYQNSPDNASGQLSIANSIIYAFAYPYRTLTGTPLPAIDNNLYFGNQSASGQLVGNYWNVNNSFYTSITAINAAFPSIDANSIERQNPLFSGIPTAGQFGLLPASEAIQSGRNWGALRWITPPDWTTLETLWESGLHVLPRDARGGSAIVVRS